MTDGTFLWNELVTSDQKRCGDFYCALLGSTRVEGLGGKIIEPPGDVPGVGRVCMVADPTGAVVLLMKPDGAM